MASPTGQAEQALASPGRRLGAVIIDALGFWVALALWLGIAIPFGDDNPSSGNVGELLGLALGVGWWVAFALYQIRAEGLLGQTIGRHLLGIEMVARDTGRPIGVWQGIARYIVRALGTYVMFLGVLWILWDQHRQGWHDKALGSLVVRTGRPVDVGRHVRAAVRGHW